MKKIQMVDLVSQYEKIKPQVQTAIHSILEKAQFINGPDVHEFKGELGSYLGAKHVIPCANGTDALQIAMMALGLKPGDEVITPSYTFIATTEVIGLLDRKSTRLNSSHVRISYAVFCLKKKNRSDRLTACPLRRHSGPARDASARSPATIPTQPRFHLARPPPYSTHPSGCPLPCPFPCF